ncbi:MAG: tetratricopeptide repeat protein, partial [Pelovirga sp.]
ECLSNVSVSYQPRYADLLSAMGQYQQAADHYTRYLETVPSDLAVLIKLGKTYRAMGAEEAAQTAFKLVLDQDPGNCTAQALAAEKRQK